MAAVIARRTQTRIPAAMVAVMMVMMIVMRLVKCRHVSAIEVAVIVMRKMTSRLCSHGVIITRTPVISVITVKAILIAVQRQRVTTKSGIETTGRNGGRHLLGREILLVAVSRTQLRPETFRVTPECKPL
jgi:hypothetical protein